MIFKFILLILLLLWADNLLARVGNFSLQNRIKLDSSRVPMWRQRKNFNALNDGPFFGQPEQVHLSYGGTINVKFSFVFQMLFINFRR